MKNPKEFQDEVDKLFSDLEDNEKEKKNILIRIKLLSKKMDGEIKNLMKKVKEEDKKYVKKKNV